MVELLDQLEVNEPAVFAPAAPQDAEQRFGHLASLYIRYLQIARKLEEAHDQMLHPQKRLDIRATLVPVMGRVLEIKDALVALNRGVSFVNLDEVLAELKLAPSELEVPVPRYFLEGRDDLRAREALLDTYVAQFGLPDGSVSASDLPAEPPSLDDAVRALQNAERARQGRERALAARSLLLDEERERRQMQLGAEAEAEAPDPHALARVLGAAWRGRLARKRVAALRREEAIFLGMELPPALPAAVDPLARLEQGRARRKHVQDLHAAEYAAALVSLRAEVGALEGPEMREELLEQLRGWYIREHEASGTFPKLSQLLAPVVVEEVPLDDKAKKALEKAEKDKAAKAKKGEAAAEEAPPADRAFADGMSGAFRLWSDKWRLRDEAANFAQRYDTELVKQLVRPDVEEAVRSEVHARIEAELANLEEAFERDRNKGKKGKGGKGKGKGKKEKKEKKPKPKGPKEPKEVAAKSLEQLYRDLVQQGIVTRHPKASRATAQQSSGAGADRPRGPALSPTTPLPSAPPPFRRCASPRTWAPSSSWARRPRSSRTRPRNGGRPSSRPSRDSTSPSARAGPTRRCASCGRCSPRAASGRWASRRSRTTGAPCARCCSAAAAARARKCSRTQSRPRRAQTSST